MGYNLATFYAIFWVSLMTNTNFSQTAAFIWSVADLLRGDFKQSQYGRVILLLYVAAPS